MKTNPCRAIPFMLRSSLHCSPADTHSIGKQAKRTIHRLTVQSIFQVFQFVTVGPGGNCIYENIKRLTLETWPRLNTNFNDIQSLLWLEKRHLLQLGLCLALCLTTAALSHSHSFHRHLLLFFCANFSSNARSISSAERKTAKAIVKRA